LWPTITSATKLSSHTSPTFQQARLADRPVVDGHKSHAGPMQGLADVVAGIAGTPGPGRSLFRHRKSLFAGPTRTPGFGRSSASRAALDGRTPWVSRFKRMSVRFSRSHVGPRRQPIQACHGRRRSVNRTPLPESVKGRP
jgi:hypothetical protein